MAAYDAMERASTFRCDCSEDSIEAMQVYSCRRRRSVHAQGRPQPAAGDRREDRLRGGRRHRRARGDPHGIKPDIVILDWEMPLLNGAEFVRMVRSPGDFPMPDVPIIMLSRPWRALARGRGGAARRERVSAASRCPPRRCLSASSRSWPSRGRWSSSATITGRRRARSRSTIEPLARAQAEPACARRTARGRCRPKRR